MRLLSDVEAEEKVTVKRIGGGEEVITIGHGVAEKVWVE